MTDFRLHDLLDRIGHVFREDLRQVATRHGLALAQLEALQFLAVANAMSDSLSAVVAYLGSTKGTVSQTLSALERKGLIERVRDDHDARRTHCRITKAGRTIVDEARPAARIAGLDPTHAEAAEALLTAMIAKREGRTFGVCRTCAHFRARPSGGHCRLVDQPLAAEQTDRRCMEHALSR